MLSDLLTVAGQVLTLFLMMAVGFLFVKLGWFSKETSGQCTQLILYAVGTSIVITKLQIDATPEVVSVMLKATLGVALHNILHIERTNTKHCGV